MNWFNELIKQEYGNNPRLFLLEAAKKGFEVGA